MPKPTALAYTLAVSPMLVPSRPGWRSKVFIWRKVGTAKLWFSFILGLNSISICFKLVKIHYHIPKQRKIKFKPRIKLNHKVYKK